MTKAPEYLDESEAKILTKSAELMRKISDERLDFFARDLKWGTYGPNGTDKLTFKPLEELDTEHIENILITQSPLPPIHIRVFLYLLKKRYSGEGMVEVTVTGHDNWSGPEILYTKDFHSKDAAEKFCKAFNAKNNLPVAPDYYETAKITRS